MKKLNKGVKSKKNNKWMNLKNLKFRSKQNQKKMMNKQQLKVMIPRINMDFYNFSTIFKENRILAIHWMMQL